MSAQRRVVVTGLGVVSPVGNDVTTAWTNILAGKSGVARITRFDPAAYRSQIAGEVRDFKITDYVPAKEVRRMDAFIHYGVAASAQALRDSGIEVTDTNRQRIGCMVGSGIGGLPMIEDNHNEVVTRGPRRISPFLIPGAIINMIA
ncbi:MAG TPA: beta-ketoacyl synthase N-terminal-like domain-containing protein, partial [Burkholderiaceae bacterium]|nr:beta-ketoacyl synthase N-terminal-like domain-containing protein [Burkholderiaceae bacterium]